MSFYQMPREIIRYIIELIPQWYAVLMHIKFFRELDEKPSRIGPLLQYAAKNNYAKVLEYFLEGAEFTGKIFELNLHVLIIVNENRECMQVLQKIGYPIKKSLLVLASRHNNKIFSDLLCDYPDKISLCVRNAISFDNIQMIREILETQNDISPRYLVYAIYQYKEWHESLEIIKLLIGHIPDAHKDPQYMRAAIKYAQYDIAKYLHTQNFALPQQDSIITMLSKYRYTKHSKCKICQILEFLQYDLVCNLMHSYDLNKGYQSDDDSIDTLDSDDDDYYDHNEDHPRLLTNMLSDDSE